VLADLRDGFEPFTIGIWMSISVKSGRCARNSWSASLPLDASATTAMSVSVATIAAMPSRSSGWSSTVRIRNFALIAA